jgi:hypothetical protein
MVETPGASVQGLLLCHVCRLYEVYIEEFYCAIVEVRERCAQGRHGLSFLIPERCYFIQQSGSVLVSRPKSDASCCICLGFNKAQSAQIGRSTSHHPIGPEEEDFGDRFAFSREPTN